jgi:H+-translocating NAD(P) transhydrogenase subunit alpha
VISNVPAYPAYPAYVGCQCHQRCYHHRGIILVGHADLSSFSVELVLGILALMFGTLNVVGGFAVTDRMLEMFKKKKK